MKHLSLAGATARRLLNRQTVAIALAISVVWLLIAQFHDDVSQRWSKNLSNKSPSNIFPGLGNSGNSNSVHRMPTHNVLPELPPRKLCYGPRGFLLGKSPEDDLVDRELDAPYPEPWAGSYEETGLDITLMTAEQRYGPYGFGEDKPEYNRSRVEWDKIDWGKLQNDCFERNRHRFPAAAKPLNDTRTDVRFSYRNVTQIPEVRHWHQFEPTRRTAIVVRTWRGFKYLPEDFYYLRSLIAETALKSGGEYQVILLVDMKSRDGYEHNIFSSPEAYEQGFKDAGVPPEFRSITILWDDNLLENWYSKISEHRTMWQVYQPMQLLALHYPEFDHFWQIEMDMRFLGDAGKYLDALARTARNDPRKQALERSMFWHMISEIGSFGELARAVDEVNAGGSFAWGPLPVPEISPIGPEPPVADPRDDDFQWGVGEEADAIVTSYCMNADNPGNTWSFRDWMGGLSTDPKPPRFYCPPAIQRASRNLLFVIHQAQLEQGIYVPSEATLPTFALWHGLKLSFPQHPVFHREKDDFEMKSQWWRGGPRKSSTGLGPDEPSHPRGLGLTFWWESDWPREIFSHFMGVAPEGEPRPWLLYDLDGKIWAPNVVLHPVKHLPEDEKAAEDEAAGEESNSQAHQGKNQ